MRITASGFRFRFRHTRATADMNLPNYFLADLGDNSTLSATMITDAAQTLKRNRALYLANRPANALVKALNSLGENWLDDDFPFRKHALDQGPALTGFSRPVLQAGLDQFFRRLNGDELLALLQQDLGDPHRFDAFVSSAPELKSNRRAFARGPELTVHITAGTLPNSTLQLMVLSLLAKSAQFIKCASGAAFIPRLFAHSLYDAEPKLGACVELAEWKGGNEALEAALFDEAGCVTASGTDESLAAIRRRLPDRVRFIGHGHRLSFLYLTKESLAGFNAKKLVRLAAEDVTAWDQAGCLSPHVIYVETNPDVPPELFAERLAAELARLEASHPRGPLTGPAAAHIASRRSIYDVRAAHSPDTRHWASENSTAWTVVFEAEPQFAISCLNRFVYVKPVHDFEQVIKGIEPVHGKVSTVGLAASDDRAGEIALRLANWGVTRICPIGRMQDPPLPWRHDGRPALADFLTWTDWET